MFLLDTGVKSLLTMVRTSAILKNLNFSATVLVGLMALSGRMAMRKNL